MHAQTSLPVVPCRKPNFCQTWVPPVLSQVQLAHSGLILPEIQNVLPCFLCLSDSCPPLKPGLETLWFGYL